MVVVVDSREPPQIPRMLAELGLEIDIRSIGFADYMVMVGDHVVLIERKEAEDFVASIEDGRVFNQAFLLGSIVDFYLIVVEGSPATALLDRRFSRRAYMGALASLVLKSSPYGARGRPSIVCVDSFHDTVLLIKYIHDQLEEGKLYRLPRLNAKGKREAEKKMVTMLALQAVPGIGPELAYRIVERFETIKSIVSTSIAELSSVPGVGVELARRIKDYFGAL